MEIKTKIKLIAFDADDTLWLNEIYYRDTEKAFAKMLEAYLPEKEVSKFLLQTETKNIPLYGYGVKGFALSMLETAMEIMAEKVDKQVIAEIIKLAKNLIMAPLKLLDGVSETLKEMNQMGLKLVLATKGDLLDQERKLKNSGLSNCFHHIEIMSNKTKDDYAKLLKRLNVKPDEFLMIGNSIKSDILPVLALGSYAIHIPYHTTWEHEKVENSESENERYTEIVSIGEILELIQKHSSFFVKFEEH
jgi:putative hydrolase of the HAD superfamily